MKKPVIPWKSYAIYIMNFIGIVLISLMELWFGFAILSVFILLALPGLESASKPLELMVYGAILILAAIILYVEGLRFRDRYREINQDLD